KRGCNQIFQHLFVVFEQARVDFNATAVMRTVDGHLDQTGTGFTRDFQLSDLFLHLLHFFLHLLSLLHQTTQTAFSTKHRLLSSFTLRITTVSQTHDQMGRILSSSRSASKNRRRVWMLLSAIIASRACASFSS